MSYSIENISSKSDCDLLISMAQKEKGDLEFRKLSLQRQQNSYEENSVVLNEELSAVNAELTAYNTIIANLPNGDLKNEQIAKQKKAELKLFMLTSKKDDYGAVALLSKEFDLARVQKELEEADNFIAAILARKQAIV